MDIQHIKYLIKNLLAGSISMSERADIAKWINSKNAEVDSLRAWDEASDFIDNSIKNEIWTNIHIDTKEAIKSKTIHSRQLYSITKIAACIAIIICASLGSIFVFNNVIKNSSAVDENFYSFEVQPGQKGSIRLSDGTIVYLNSASKITFAGNYNSKNRIVNLEGEAYFDVAKNPNKKFIVSCNGIEVEALGTEFNVKAYPSDSIITTTLAEGKVKVSNNDESITLLPHDVATYNLKQHSIKSSTIDDISIADYWRSGKLVFEGETLASIAQTIQRMYNIKISIKDENIKSMKFSGTIQNNSLDNVMHVISLSYPLTYTMTDSIITISAKK